MPKMRKTELVALVDERVDNAMKAAPSAHARRSTQNPMKAPVVTTRSKDAGSVMGAMIGLKFRCKAAGYSPNAKNLRAVALREYGPQSNVVKALSEAVRKNMTARDANQGLEFVPTMVSDEIIEALTPRTVMRRNGARVLENPTGKMDVGRMTSAVSGTWVGEGASHGNRATTVPTDKVSLEAFKMLVTVPVSKDLLQFAGPNVEQAVLDNVLDGAAVTEDQTFLRGAGSSTSPTGILNQIAAGNKFTSAFDRTNPSATIIEEEIGKLKLLLMNANITISEQDSVFLMSSRTAEYLERLRDANGNKIYPEMVDGKLGRFKYDVTNSIPNNLDIDATAGEDLNGSEMYFMHFPHIYIADSNVASIEVLENVTYTDSAGNLQTTVDTDEVLVRLKLQTDIAMRYDLAAAVNQGVPYGAPSS